MMIAFVNDADFYTSVENSEKEMQRIINQCAKLHEATGGKIQQEKTCIFV